MILHAPALVAVPDAQIDLPRNDADAVEVARVQVHLVGEPFGVEAPAFDERGHAEIEGPYGELYGLYGPMHPDPLFHVTAITHRRDVLHHTLLHGGQFCFGWINHASSQLCSVWQGALAL